MKKQKKEVHIWARVPASDVEKIERSRPKYGWRTTLVRAVVARLAEKSVPASRPTHDDLIQEALKAVDELDI